MLSLLHSHTPFDRGIHIKRVVVNVHTTVPLQRVRCLFTKEMVLST